MTTAGLRQIVAHLGAGDAGGTALVSVHLPLPELAAFADLMDGSGQSVVLVGLHQLGDSGAARDAVAEVKASLGAGVVPEAVHAMGVAPLMAAALVEIVAGASAEVMLDGERGTGKSVGMALTLPMLAELRARAGYALPLLVLWVHDSLASASAKTVPGLMEPLWGGCWRISDGGRLAEFVLAGTVYVEAHFVGATDQQSAERLKAACHVVVVEEPVPSLAEGGGVDQNSYDVARSSMRLPTPRAVSIVVTNPGSPEHWCYQRFISPGRPGAVRCRVPASDRLSAEEIARLRDSFTSPDLRLRLAEGEWADMQLGPVVAIGYNVATHTAPHALAIPRSDLVLGWDSAPNAHTHAVVIGARIDSGVYVYAGLVAEETGLQQFLDAVVLPWFSRRAPWALGATGRERLFHRYDPAMNPDEGGDIEQNAVRRIRRALGGTFHEGGTTWAARAAAMLALLNLGNGRGGMALQICPSDDTRGLRRALGGAWYYTVTRGGSVVRDLPAKPNHPWEDLGDAFCYFAGGVAPSRDRDARPPQEVRYAIHGRIDPWTGKPREGSTQGSAQGGDRWPRR